MLKRSLAAGLLACVALAPLAQAQGNPPASQPQQQGQSSSGNFIRTVDSGQFRGSDLMGQKVFNQQNENIGSIGDILVDRQGRVAGVVIDVGGFLGIGANEVAVRYGALRFEPEQARTASASQPESTGRSATDQGGAPAAGSGTAGMANPGAAGSSADTQTGRAATGESNQMAAGENTAGSDSTVHARIVLNASRADLTSAPKLDDTAARAPGQTGPGSSGNK